jgi:hypothetical protein
MLVTQFPHPLIYLLLSLILLICRSVLGHGRRGDAHAHPAQPMVQSEHMLERVVPGYLTSKATLEGQHWMQADALRVPGGPAEEHTKEVEDIRHAAPARREIQFCWVRTINCVM